MNKKIAVLTIIFLILASCLLSACEPDTEENPSLDTPVLAKDGNVVYWGVVDNATTYVVNVWTSSQQLQTTSTLYEANAVNSILYYSLPQELVGTYSVEVIAWAEGYNSSRATIVVTIDLVDDDNNVDNGNGENITPDPDDEQGENVSDDILVDEEGDLFLPQELYCKSGNDKDLVIDCAQDVTINAISAIALDDKYVVDNDKHIITISSEWTKNFSAGAKIALTIEYGLDKSVKTYINFVQELPYTLSNNVITYTKLSGTGFKVKITEAETSSGIVKKVAIDDVILNNSYISYSSSSNSLTILENPVLKSLSVGEHILQVYTDRGMSTAIIKVRVGLKYEPYDVIIDCDESYPKAKITWRDDADEVQKYIVVIDNVSYDSVGYANLFDGRSFDATGLIDNYTQVLVKAVVDRYTYTSQPVYCYVDVNDAVQQKYLSKTYEFLGQTHNYYITSEAEMKDFLYFFLLHYDEFEDATVEVEGLDYSGYKQADVYWSINGQLPQGNLYDKITGYLNTFSEGMSTKHNVFKSSDGSSNEVSIVLLLRTAMEPESANSKGDQLYYEYNGKQGRFSKVGRSIDYDDWAINKIEKTASVSSTYELYMAMERGYRPIPKVGSNAERIYNKAKDVLREIIDDSMDDLDKVRAIYDWLSINVIYDHKLASDSGNIIKGSKEYYALYGNAAFYAEGVFDNGLAVCNGIAIAFDILCRIEGIECYKVLGQAGSVDHAWNRVKVGGYWYISDPTWGSKAVRTGDYYVEYLVEDYMLMDYEESKPYYGGNHYETTSRSGGSEHYAGDTNYDVYANTLFYDHVYGRVYDTILSQRDKEYIDKLLLLIVDDIDGNMDIGEYRIGVKCSQTKWNNLYGASAFSIADGGYKVSFVKHPSDDTKGFLVFEKLSE
ncbi:MAG: transglutaminase domain-containing protein [Christensenellales bacterium]